MSVLRRKRRRIALWTVMLVGAGVSGVASSQTTTPAQGWQDWLGAVWEQVGAQLDAASQELAKRPVPPIPARVDWSRRKLASLDLTAPIVAANAGDLDSDGRAEVLLMTDKEVVVVRLGKNVEEERIPLTLPSALGRPRHSVGAAIFVPRVNEKPPYFEFRSSYHAHSVRAVWDETITLVSQPEEALVSLCPHTKAPLVFGRNYYDTKQLVGNAMGLTGTSELFYDIRCGINLLDPQGIPVEAIAMLDLSSTLRVRHRSVCQREQHCDATKYFERVIEGVGTAFSITDIDSDGHIEVAIAADTPPGQADRLRVLSFATTPASQVYAARFSYGIIAIVTADIDGDGDLDMLAFARSKKPHRVHIWKLNR